MQNSSFRELLERQKIDPNENFKYDRVFFLDMNLEHTLSNILHKYKNINLLYKQNTELVAENTTFIEKYHNLSVLNEKLMMENQKITAINSELEIHNKIATQEKFELLSKIERLKKTNREIFAQIHNLQNSEIIIENQIPAQQTIDFELQGIQEIPLEQYQKIQEAKNIVQVEQENLNKCPMCGKHSREKTFECPYCKKEGIITFICSRHFQSHLNKYHPTETGKKMWIEGGTGVYKK